MFWPVVHIQVVHGRSSLLCQGYVPTVGQGLRLLLLCARTARRSLGEPPKTDGWRLARGRAVVTGSPGVPDRRPPVPPVLSGWEPTRGRVFDRSRQKSHSGLCGVRPKRSPRADRSTLLRVEDEHSPFAEPWSGCRLLRLGGMPRAGGRWLSADARSRPSAGTAASA
jgi:hypothetical protein